MTFPLHYLLYLFLHCNNCLKIILRGTSGIINLPHFATSFVIAGNGCVLRPNLRFSFIRRRKKRSTYENTGFLCSLSLCKGRYGLHNWNSVPCEDNVKLLGCVGDLSILLRKVTRLAAHWNHRLENGSGNPMRQRPALHRVWLMRSVRDDVRLRVFDTARRLRSTLA